VAVLKAGTQADSQGGPFERRRTFVHIGAFD
jgi:hypothetical protein